MVTRKKSVATNRRRAYVFCGAICFVFCMLYIQTPTKPDQATALAKMDYITTIDLKHFVMNLTLQINETEGVSSKYLVYSSKCKIPNLDPFSVDILPFYSSKKYVKCSDKNLLTYVTKDNNLATLHIDERFVNEYGEYDVSCCYRTITRDPTSAIPDMHIDISPCFMFVNKTVMTADTILVSCLKNHWKEVYKNVHTVIRVNDKVRQKMKKFGNSGDKQHLSVLFVGIDSVSRLNLIRSMPDTYHFLQKNGWVEIKGYNKIGDNTFPNLMGVLTGRNETAAFKDCNPRILGPLDKCNFVWFDYRKLGYVTGYAEDGADINTFNYLKKGFKDEPTDYYFRSYTLATEEHLDIDMLDGTKYCTGPETAGERILNVAREFSSTFKNYPNFGFFWMNSFSHDDVNSASKMDTKIVDFLSDINKTEVLENSIVIFISDHGFRFGEIVYTHTGWLEERLPFFYMSIPRWFKKKYPRKYQNLIKNSERLTTPYDLYMTLQDILVISGKKYVMKESSACPKCKSLFEEIEAERSCEDAAIEHHWCTCSGYFTISPKGIFVEEAAKFILNEIRKTAVNTGGDYQQCTNFELTRIISAGISDTNASSISHKNNFYFLITFETYPKAVFQGTVSINVSTAVPVFKMEGSISRLDIYSANSWCVNDSILKKYCYCQGTVKYIFSIFSRGLHYIKHFLSGD